MEHARAARSFAPGLLTIILVLRSDGHGIEIRSCTPRASTHCSPAGAWHDCPEWYRHGIALALSAASFDQDRLTIGREREERSRAWPTTGFRWPEFLPLPRVTQRATGARSPGHGSALRRAMLVAGALEPPGRGLDKVMPSSGAAADGGEPAIGLAATFGIRLRERLDEYFTERGSATTSSSGIQHVIARSDAVRPRAPMSAAEVRARLAELLLVHDRSPSDRSADGHRGARHGSEKFDGRCWRVAQHDMAPGVTLRRRTVSCRLPSSRSLSPQAHRDLGMLLVDLAANQGGRDARRCGGRRQGGVEGGARAFSTLRSLWPRTIPRPLSARAGCCAAGRRLRPRRSSCPRSRPRSTGAPERGVRRTAGAHAQIVGAPRRCSGTRSPSSAWPPPRSSARARPPGWNDCAHNSRPHSRLTTLRAQGSLTWRMSTRSAATSAPSR